MKNLEELQLTTKEYYKNSFLNVREDEVKLPDGLHSKRVVVAHPGGVSIIALDQDSRLLLVEQFRYPINRVTLETPAGKIEKGEKTIVTALRELEEETGHTAKALTLVSKIATTPGFTDEWIETYIATDVTEMQTKIAGDADEFINVVRLTKSEAIEAIQSEAICDFKTIYAVQYLTLNNLW